ncbi:MAG: stage IV sporulation protein A [Lachnospiraceae bacterium]
MENQMGQEGFSIYQDIQKRTGGEIYIGVVGPVRTGKSTFIRRFMEQMVLPYMTDENEKKRAQDEMPQAAQGKTIMTTEPKFIPKNAATIQVEDGSDVKVRLIDCVGFLVDGAGGQMEDGAQRLVKTPWSEEEIPFSQAAETGTEKVIGDHATIAVAITSDGTTGEFLRDSYIPAEQRTIQELKKYKKPFVLVLNTQKPYSEQTQALAQELAGRYQVTVLPINCEQMKKDDIQRILSSILLEFPLTEIDFTIPKWVEMLPQENEKKQAVIRQAAAILQSLTYAKDIKKLDLSQKEELIEEILMDRIDLSTGRLQLRFQIKEKYYYENMSELAGVPIEGEYQLVEMVRQFAKMKEGYDEIHDAMQAVRLKGYGVINPKLSEVSMDEPVLIRHGNKFGVRLKAVSPSIHMIRANIETELAPIVGSEDQANDLIRYIKEGQKTQEGVWNTNIFGKSIGELVEDGIRNKITQMDDECQLKLQDTMQKIVNDNNGGMVCIII